MSAIEVAEVFWSRLARLTHTLLKPQFEGPEGLWSFQLRLLALQQDVQADISRLRGSRPYDLQDLEELRSVLWEARRLGDAFAWLTFGLKKQHIVPLGANDPVPVPPDDDTLLGFKTAVRGLTSPELGFPVLHDITDCLRIGDVTYVNPEGDPVTLEVKTRIEAEEPERGGVTKKSFSVSFLGHGRNVTLPARLRTSDGLDSALQQGLPPSAFRGRRAQRQVERMASAWDRQFAPEGLRGTDEPVLVMNVRCGSTEGTDELRRVVRLARRRGFAFAKVNHAEVVYAFYSHSGVKEPDLEAVDLSRLLIESEILYLEPDMLGENSILITEIPRERRRAAQEVVPYHLLGLPRSTVIDIQRGRMVVVSVLNVGRLVADLEAAGISVSTENGTRNWLDSGMLAGRVFALDDDQPDLFAQVGGLSGHIEQMVQEFLGPSYFVDVVRQMLDAAEAALPDLRRSDGA